MEKIEVHSLRKTPLPEDNQQQEEEEREEEEWRR